MKSVIQSFGRGIRAKCKIGCQIGPFAWRRARFAENTALAIVGACLIVATVQAQITDHSKHRFGPYRATVPRSFVERASILPATVSPDIIWVQCPAEAQALGATCGRLPVPLDRHHTEGEKVRIYFEIYFHSNSGAAESAIVANAGGPSLTTTGLRTLWLGVFAPNLDVHDLLLIDDRGRGMSGLLVCPELQHGTGTSPDQEVADCAAQLGDDDSLYSTGDVAFDVEAVRGALGYEKLDYYGGSYGGMDVSAYASRFGDHLRSVILDSPAGPVYLAPFVNHRYSNAAVVTELRLDCQRSPTCSPDHPNPDAELDWLIHTVRNKPLRGRVNGYSTPLEVDEVVLEWIAVNNSDGSYLEAGELLAAAEALKHGDKVPLLRLGVEGFTPLLSDWGNPAFFSVAAYMATGCVDSQMLFDWSSPPPVRLMQYADAVANLPSDYFAPFSKAATANEQISITDRGCVFWEEPTPPTPVIAPNAIYPSVPTLAFNSDIDATVPTELAVQTANLFPNSTLLIVKDGRHEPAESNACAAGLATYFVEHLALGDTSCTKSPETVWPALGRFPLFARDARPAEVDPDGGNEIDVAERKVVTVAVATAIDALKRSIIGSSSGLRSGTFQTTYSASGQTTTLSDCSFSKDVTVNGSLTWGTDFSFVADLTVSGTGTSGGILRVEGTWEAPGPVGNFKVSGTIGGKNVAVLVPEG